MSGAAPGITRENLSARTLVRLGRGARRSPDVLLVESDAGLAVVKDYAGGGALLRRVLGPWLARREIRAYRRLEGHPSVPRLLGRVDALAFAVEHRPGPRLSNRRPWTFSPAFGVALGEAVQGLHARGVVHLDLGHRSNVRAGTDGKPVLIDFGASVCFRPGGLGERWLLPLLARVDRRALRKWQRRLGRSDAAQLPAADAAAVGSSEGARGASRPT